MTLTRLALLAAFAAGCTCGKKRGGPVARPARVHAWASLGNVEQSFGDVAVLAGRFGFPLGKDSLRDLVAKTSGLPPDLLAEVDLTKPIWSAGVQAVEPSAGYTYVYAVALRDEKKFLEALRAAMTESRSGDISKWTPKSAGAMAMGTVFMAIEGRHALVSPEQPALELAREWMIRALVPVPAQDDLAVTLTREFLANWQQSITDVANAQAAVLAGFAQRVAARARSIQELSLRVDLGPEALALGMRIEAPSGAMHDVIARQVPGPPYALGAMPAESWVYYSDRYNPAALAEALLDAKQALDAMPGNKRDDVSKAIATLAGTLSGEIAGGGSGAAAIVAAKVRDAKAAREGIDAIVAWLAGTSEARREGALSVVELPIPGGFVPPLITGRPAIATFVDGDRLILGVGVDAEAHVTQAAAGAGQRLDKDAAFAKTAPAAPGRVGLLYVSVGRMLQSAVAAVPGAPVPSGGNDFKGVLLDWKVNEARTAMDVTLSAPVDAFAALAPIFRALPLGFGR